MPFSGCEIRCSIYLWLLELADSRQGASCVVSAAFADLQQKTRSAGLRVSLFLHTTQQRDWTNRLRQKIWTFLFRAAKIGNVSLTCKFYGIFFKYFKRNISGMIQIMAH